MLSATTLFTSNASAQADTADVSAQDGDFVLYQHDDQNFWGGTYFVFWPDGHCASLSGKPMNNSASSMTNTTDRTVRLYDSSNCSGAVGYTAKPNSEDDDFSNNGFDNKASSMR
nr:hypothetical protein GCM10010200_052530 [Actinomadura rugatobispora]